MPVKDVTQSFNKLPSFQANHSRQSEKIGNISEVLFTLEKNLYIMEVGNFLLQ